MQALHCSAAYLVQVSYRNTTPNELTTLQSHNEYITNDTTSTVCVKETQSTPIPEALKNASP